MCRLFETIRVENGVPDNLTLHQHRLNRSQQAHFSLWEPIALHRILEEKPPPSPGLFKLRIIYAQQLLDIQWEPYQMRHIKRLYLLPCETFSYPYKYYDRTAWELLRNGLSPEEEILVVQNGTVTDTSFSNILCLSNGKWLTPETPLLEGTRRQSLLDSGKVFPSQISPQMLMKSQGIQFINAMIRFGDHPVILPEKICRAPGT